MSEWDGKNRRKESWHLRKEVNLTHVLTTAGLTAGLFVWGATMDKRVTVLEEIIKRQDIEVTSLSQNIEINVDQIRSDLRELRNAFIESKKK